MFRFARAALLCSFIISASEALASYSVPSGRKKIRVAVIDTGIDPSLNATLCPDGHKDFTGTSLVDLHGHGSHVSGLIDQYAKNQVLDVKTVNSHSLEQLMNTKIDYCQVIIKYFMKGNTGEDNLRLSNLAMKHAIDLKVDFINYSAGGSVFDLEESKLIKRALDSGITVVVAAGNDGEKFHSKKSAFASEYTYYPALYDSRLIVVGNSNDDGTRAIRSNFGSEVDVWEIGTNVLSLRMYGRFSFMSGTSQATAIHTGKLIRQLMLR